MICGGPCRCCLFLLEFCFFWMGVSCLRRAHATFHDGLLLAAGVYWQIAFDGFFFAVHCWRLFLGCWFLVGANVAAVAICWLLTTTLWCWCADGVSDRPGRARQRPQQLSCQRQQVDAAMSVVLPQHVSPARPALCLAMPDGA